MIYFDNSATSHPKPVSVERAVKRAYREYFANAGRGSTRDTLASANALYESRVSLAELVGTIPENIIFTYNATYALNMAIQGTVKEGDRVAVDRFAHNSVLRPLYALEKRGVSVELLKTDLLRDSTIISCFEKLVREKKVNALVLTHTSNVTGKTLPVKRLSKICREFGITLILDASQGLGYTDINMNELGVDILASSGHKGIFGIMGSGFLAVREGFKGDIIPIIRGGSGIYSLHREMPEMLPERLEAGTVSTIAAQSMKAGADFVKKIGASEIGYKTKRLRTRIIEGLSEIKDVDLLNDEVSAKSIILFNIDNMPSERLAEALNNRGIEGRAGYHCAPLAHKLIGKDKADYDGAMRISVGYFNTDREADKFLLAVKKIAEDLK